MPIHCPPTVTTLQLQVSAAGSVRSQCEAIRHLATIRWLRLWGFALASIAGLPTAGWSQWNGAEPLEVAEVRVDQRLGEQIPLDLQFQNERGQTVRLRDYFDGRRPVLLTLNYSNCPMLCNVQLNRLVETLQKAELGLELGSDFQMLSVSIDPREPFQKAALTKQRYLEQLGQSGAATAWHFLVGKPDAIKSLADVTGFRYRYDPKTREYYHPAMLVIASPQGTISSYRLTFDYEPEPLKLAMIAAGQGQIGSLVEQAILWCYDYDPVAGSYVANAWRLMRLGGVVTVVVLLLMLTPYWFGRDRQPKQPSGRAEGEMEPQPTIV